MRGGPQVRKRGGRKRALAARTDDGPTGAEPALVLDFSDVLATAGACGPWSGRRLLRECPAMEVDTRSPAAASRGSWTGRRPRGRH